MSSDQREKVLVDKRLQQAVAKRTVMYWCVTWLVVFSLPILIRTLTEAVPFSQLASQIIGDFWFPIVISIFLLPIVIWDSYRFSNRIAGPVFRVDQAIRECGKQPNVPSLKVRDDDFCESLVEGVNELIEILETQKRPCSDTLETEKAVQNVE